MRFTKALVALAAVAAAALIMGAPAAQADGCPSDQSVLDYSKNDPPYQCAVHSWSSKKSIGSWDTKSWSSDTALGYYVESKCAYRSSSDVSWTWSAAGPSYSATFTNWATSTRHFGTGVIFTTGSVDSDQIKSDSGCANGDGKIENAIKRITQSVKIDSVSGYKYWGETLTISGSISPSDATGVVVLLVNGDPVMTSTGNPIAAQIADGKFSMAWKTPQGGSTKNVNLAVAYQGDESACPAAAKSCGYTPGQSANTTIKIQKAYIVDDDDGISSEPTLLSSGPSLAGGGASASVSSSGQSDPGIKLINVKAKTPKKLGAKCPDGFVPLHAELWGGNSSRLLSFGKHGASLKKGAIKDGRKVGIQLTCRKSGKGKMNHGKAGFGTPKADRMKTRKAGSLLLGGPGRDSLTVTRKKGVANGGLGADRLTLRKPGVAIGGAGDDTLRSTTGGRTLLIGGPGRDHYRARGKARIDARDGRADRIVCVGKKVQVRADRFDRLAGACKRV